MANLSPEEDDIESAQAALLALAKSLGEIRDVLVEASCLLRDARFDLDVEQRMLAAEQLKVAMERIAAR